MRKNSRRRVRIPVLTVVVGAVILLGAVVPRNIFPAWFAAPHISAPGRPFLPFSAPLLHVYAFGAFTIVQGVAMRRRENPGRWRWLVAATASGLAFGLAIELSQIILPHRAFELPDLVMSALGVGLGAAVLAGARACSRNGSAADNCCGNAVSPPRSAADPAASASEERGT